MTDAAAKLDSPRPAADPAGQQGKVGEDEAARDAGESTAVSAGEVARGVMRLFARNAIWCLGEVPLVNRRRADLMGLDARGQVVIVEIKVARGDLLGDAKWPDYLDLCDRFFWAVPPALDRAPLASPDYAPEKCGIIVADGYDAEIVRPAPLDPLAAARRKVQVERLARIAMRRQTAALDPQCAPFALNDVL